MYEQFGFTRTASNQQSFTLFVPDNPSQYSRGGPCRITEVRLVGDFQQRLNPAAANWDAPSGLLMTASQSASGSLFTYKVPVPLPDGYYQYQYIVKFQDGTVRRIGDPCTKYGGDSNDRSAFVIGGSAVNAAPLATRKPPGELRIYELMIDDFTIGYRKNRAPLDAIVDKLDDLAALNINAIEFMPWIAWPDDTDFSWGYDPAYFFSVESKYMNDAGNPLDRLSRLASLITECHQRGLHVLLDIVLQHARQGATTNGFPYYWLWQNPSECPLVGQFVNAQTYGSLPLDYGNACTQQFFGDVCKYWIDRFKIDGLRFDQVTGYDNPDFPKKGAPGLIADLRQYLASNSLDNFALILEDSWGLDVVDSANRIQATGAWFDPYRSAPFGIFTGYAVTGHVDSGYMRILNAAKGFNSPIGPVNYIENHDHGSITCRVGSRDRWYKLQPYMIALATCSGAIMIHNGQEWGQYEDIWEDDTNAPKEDRRVQSRPLLWNQANDTIGVQLRSLYQFLLGLRRDYAGLCSANFYPNDYDPAWTSFSADGYGIDEKRQIILYHRWGTAANGNLERFIVALNFSDATQYADISFPSSGAWTDLLNGNRVEYASNYRLSGYAISSNWGCVFWQGS